MNTAPGFNPYQNQYQPSIQQLRTKLLPGMITAGAAALLAIIGAALPAIQAEYMGQGDSFSTFGMAFDEALGAIGTLVGILLILSILVFGLAPVIAYFKPTAGWATWAGIASIAGATVGLLCVILLIFVLKDNTGMTASSTISAINEYQPGVASFGIGLWLTLIALVAGIVGGVLFFVSARPFDYALRAMKFGGVPNALYQGQPGQFQAQQGQFQGQRGQFQQGQPGQYPGQAGQFGGQQIQPGQHTPQQGQYQAHPGQQSFQPGQQAQGGQQGQYPGQGQQNQPGPYNPQS